MKDARSIPHKGQAALRIRAIKALEKGKSRKEVSELFGVSMHAIYLWMRKVREGGIENLQAKRKGRPTKTSKLKPLECAWLVKAIVDKTPDQLKLPYYLWTRAAVQKLIKDKFGLEVSRWTVGRMLKGWGLTPQKPAKQSYRRDDKKVQIWLKEEYPKIKQRAEKEKAQIHWQDEMGARSDDQVGRTYGKKGQTPIAKISGNRFSCNMMASITNQGQLEFMMYTESFTYKVLLKFLKRLIKNKEQKIFLIMDNHPVHKSKKVTAWLQKNMDKIEVFFLPPYCPDLNPAEYLNHDVKANAVRRKKAKDQKELKSNIACFLSLKQKQPNKVANYFKAKLIKYAA